MTTFWGGAQFFFGGGVKGAQLKGSHVSTCWNPEMLFSLRYGVTFRGLRFGHHVSESNVSTFHVSAAAKPRDWVGAKIFVYVFFGVIPCGGEKKNIDKVPQNPGTIP